MGDWPTLVYPPIVTLSTFHAQGIGGRYSDTLSQALIPAANRAHFLPFVLYEPLIARLMFLVNGTAVNGNVDLGIYDKSGVRIVSSGGGDAQAGVSDAQSINIPDTLLGPGSYYFALAMDNPAGTARLTGSIVATFQTRWSGLAYQAGAFPLPAQAVLAAPSATYYLPVFGLSTRTFI